MEKKYYAVDSISIEGWRKRLNRAINEMAVGSHPYEWVKAVEFSLGRIYQNSVEVPVELTAGISKGDLVKKLGIDFTIDYALPQPWVNDVEEKTGQNPCPHIVWSYKEGTGAFGEAYPITDKGKAILWDYEQAIK